MPVKNKMNRKWVLLLRENIIHRSLKTNVQECIDEFFKGDEEFNRESGSPGILARNQSVIFLAELFTLLAGLGNLHYIYNL